MWMHAAYLALYTGPWVSSIRIDAVSWHFYARVRQRTDAPTTSGAHVAALSVQCAADVDGAAFIPHNIVR